MACVTVLYVNDYVSSMSNIFQIKTAVVHSEFRIVVELFERMVSYLKLLTIFAKSSASNVLNSSLN